jgi:hypothetical protein
MRLEIGRFPAGGQHQEQRAIGAIASGRPGFLPSGRNHFPVLIAHLPAEVAAALEDHKFQHLSGKHRGRVIIPLKGRILRAQATDRTGRVAGMARPGPENKTPAGLWGPAGAYGKVGARLRIAQVSRQGPGWKSALWSGSGQDDFVSNPARVACTAREFAQPFRCHRPDGYSAMNDVVLVPES